ncbi:class I adenylate-forming enzyme family protein [Mycolicibacterium mucogenicum]|uniref:AMP-binding protein n=1 Tax=Mycolicibacterium mucogenicum DSM 44124 TaxID=1226753 RepID=A0A8H2JB30_MYCMU|nr:AMP-binding protein [Mycolicibacterium mucogenicum]KAB7761358.1 acyl-CoA ligase [Mycolicibacterium mucogenicum DSM 44124]QPG70183.1 AMP-binding protein [Mycolicibacterium mucogenicum DSM 44124]
MSSTSAIAERRGELRAHFPVWREHTLDAWLDECAARYASRPFVLTDDVSLTYRQVADESRRLAAGLTRLGVRPGDRVGLIMANYPEFVTMKFAIARVGAVAVPFNYLYRSDELAFVLEDSGCRLLVTMTGFGDLDYQAMLDDIVPGWDRDDFANRSGRSGCITALRHVVVLETDRPRRAGVRSVRDLAELAGADVADHAASQGDPRGPGDILYTSGTTGSPKGVMTSHDGVLRTAFASALSRAYEDGRRILFSLPCYHMFGYVEGLLSVMYVGGAVVLQPRFSAEGYFRGIEQHRATDILCVPTMAVALVESPARENFDLSSLSAILCGSAPAPIWLWQRIERDFGVSEIVTGYGMTECGGAMTLTLPEDGLSLTSETVGRPKLAGAAAVAGTDALVTYRVVDPTTGVDVEPGAEGELISSGPATMLGYWNRAAETSAALRGGWLWSGDLGCRCDDGYLRVTGRTKEMYKSGGELVMPKEIEDLLAVHPDISQVFAVGLTDDRWGEIGCVIVIPAPGAAITEQDVLDICRARLARFKVPKRVVFYRADQLPTTPTGKVQKFRLVQQLRSGGGAPTD